MRKSTLPVKMGVWKKQKTFRITRDLMRLLQKEHLLIFQSTLPDPRSRAPVTAIARFQSTLPERGETCQKEANRRNNVISIHSPRMGRDGAWPPAPPARCISIHSPRMGRDPGSWSGRGWENDFNPLSPHGERHGTANMVCGAKNFNPLSPHGERHSLYHAI